MPRRRTVTDSPEGDALDQAARDHSKAEQVYEAKRQVLRERIHAARRSGMTISEIARRAGYTREHVSSIVNESDKGDVG
jgi:CRP-like cAMP-binding protein